MRLLNSFRDRMGFDSTSFIRTSLKLNLKYIYIAAWHCDRIYEVLLYGEENNRRGRFSVLAYRPLYHGMFYHLVSLENVLYGW